MVPAWQGALHEKNPEKIEKNLMTRFCTGRGAKNKGNKNLIVANLEFSQGNRALLGVQNGSFSAFWHYKNKERLSKSLEVKWHIPSTCLEASRKWFATGIYIINRLPSFYG